MTDWADERAKSSLPCQRLTSCLPSLDAHPIPCAAAHRHDVAAELRRVVEECCEQVSDTEVAKFTWCGEEHDDGSRTLGAARESIRAKFPEVKS